MNSQEPFCKIRHQIDADLPIAAAELVAAGYVSRPTLWRMERAGLPVTRIWRRIFVRFSDLVAFRGGTVAEADERQAPGWDGEKTGRL